MFELFDPVGDVDIRQGSNLPHWYQPGATYFITFRAEDSIPQSVARSWRLRRIDWLRRHGIDGKAPDWRTCFDRLPQALQQEFHRTFTKEYQDALDKGLGACVLRRPELAAKVGNSLRKFDGDRYHLGDFVVMPNHVHLLACLIGTTDLQAQCQSWKRYMAGEINQVLGCSGRFWQEESFDHLVRSPEQFEALRRYIAANPQKAGLSEGEFLSWRRPPQ